MPEVLKHREVLHIALWQWLGFLIILLAGGRVGMGGPVVLNRLLRQFDTTWSRAAAQAIRGPGAVAVGVWIVYILIKVYLDSLARSSAGWSRSCSRGSPSA